MSKQRIEKPNGKIVNEAFYEDFGGCQNMGIEFVNGKAKALKWLATFQNPLYSRLQENRIRSWKFMPLSGTIKTSAFDLFDSYSTLAPIFNERLKSFISG